VKFNKKLLDRKKERRMIQSPFPSFNCPEKVKRESEGRKRTGKGRNSGEEKKNGMGKNSAWMVTGTEKGE